MNTQREALDALEEIHPGNMTPMAEQAWNKAINAIREALAEPEQKPLTDERIDQIIASNVTITDKYLLEAVYMAIREVEQEHGIGEA